MKYLHTAFVLAIAAYLVFTVGCGGNSSSGSQNTTFGGGSTSTTPTGTPTPTPRPTATPSPTSTPATGTNTTTVTVNGGPNGNYADGIFASVTVCIPGSGTCQTIPNVLVDTGSTGLRLVNTLLTISLPLEKPSGSPLGNCVQYVDSSYNWGLVAIADVTLGSETASSVPIQLIGDQAEGGADASFPQVPSPCSTNGTGTKEDDVAALGANGIIGIGPFLQDCGQGCVTGAQNNPPLYYNCPTATTCTGTTVTLAQQLQNPISMFPVDNNGDIIELPAVSSSGQASQTGSLVFGINTETNNQLASAAIYEMDPTTQGFATTYNGTTYGASGAGAGNFLDSGSNGLFFLDAATSHLTDCSGSSGFYCSSGGPFTVQNQSSSGLVQVSWSVVSANTLFANPANEAFSTLAGPNPNQFDFGLSFFFGRNVYTAFEAPKTVVGAPVGTTYPFWAF